MKKNPSRLGPYLVGAVVFAAGVYLGWRNWGSPRPDDTASAPAASAAPATTPVRFRTIAKSARFEQAPPRARPADPAAARRRAGLATVLAGAAESERVSAALNLAEELADADVLEVLELMQTLPGPASEALGLSLIQLWRQEKPAEAADLLVSVFPVGQQTTLLQQVLLNWTMQDWPGAVGFVQEMPPGPDRLVALRQVVSTWLRNDPAAASAAIEKLGEGNQTLLGLTASLWVRLDPEAAADWAENLPAGTARDATVSALVAAWAQKDPLVAAEHVLSRPASTGQIISVISGLAVQAPDLATELAMSFPAGRDRDYAIENAYYRWAQVDAQGAIEGAIRLGWGAERDKAIYAVAGSLVAINPADAARSALAIGDTHLRDYQAERAAREWLKLDPPTARHWILTSPLPDQRKRALLENGGT